MAHPDQHGRRQSISSRRPYLITFSGIDGAGKTTQIDAVLKWLHHAGLRARLLRFWDDIAVAGCLREAMSHALFESEKGVGSPDKPVARRDKNVRAWYMTVARLLLYFLDAVHLAFVVAITSSSDADVVVFDRYLYDELANLELERPLERAYARLLLKLVPCPDVAFLLDADPAQARARKPEYPLAFLRNNRSRYKDLAKLADGITTVAPLPVEDVTGIVLEEVATALLGAGPTSPGQCAVAAESHQ